MKPIVIIFFAAVSMAACKSNDKKAAGNDAAKNGTTISDADALITRAADTAGVTTIQWLDSTYLDLGKQKEGKEIEITFRFKNTGSKNLVIESVSAQCGCTIPEKPEKPFAPGEEGVIRARYNGSGHGEVRKEIYVAANTEPDRHSLTFRAELEK